ncbi:MAG TPA: type II CAAX endopeptidase family protein [Actinomycetota bacterium]|nr:type II CAAX endopeptidase family protein [Actinomycetota bacterium]
MAFAALLGGVGGSAVQLTALAFQVFLVTFTLLWVSTRYRGAVRALGIRSRRPTRDLALGAWFGAALFGVLVFVVRPAVVLAWQVVTGEAPPPIQQEVLPRTPDLVQVVLGVVAVVFAGPFGEELFFRGFLFGALRARLGLLPGVLLSAAVFGLFHFLGGPLLVALMFCFGIAVAVLFHRRGSLAAPVAAHALFNLIGYTLIVVERV